jgi:hypothetical protein
MADETTQTVEETRTWQYQVRDKDGNVVGEWTAPEDDFKWPRAAEGQTRWVRKNERWAQAK